ncbi:phosphoethanolamine transferase [Novilysobacter selenitireducens]|uniref:Phosphoethanolamine transferase n=1 Tax=Novilysobacter selenitireducens TaxID=2872639 RepID=A0ABS7T802_9GAMM|nr:phosphoethanolamine--lipid A transferase [Lysobacter selenitireducens]MBZ4040012.1 phosphoethanolamine transferase [Lysobacter selenitireducens]
MSSVAGRAPFLLGLADTVRRISHRLWQWRPRASVELLALLAGLFFALGSNSPFWHAALIQSSHPLRLAGSLFAMLVGLHGLLLGLVLPRRWAKPVLMVLLLTTACATYFMQSYGVYVDADMLQNVLQTDWAESRELMTPAIAIHVLLYAGVPCAVLSRVTVTRRPFRQAIAVRAGFLLSMWILVMLGTAVSFKDLSSLLRNQHEARYLVTPANVLYGLGNLVVSRPEEAIGPRLPVATDARQVLAAGRRNPRLLVLVVGETVRAQNWGLNGYRRQTTPGLARQDVINFGDMHACGSNTEVSLPCMFSLNGREGYDRGKILSHQSLLHVLERVGVEVWWRDNQSGCKSVCEGLRFEPVTTSRTGACNGPRCLDEALLENLPVDARSSSGRLPGDRLLVLHMLGNHGPDYSQRYPSGFRRFLPACETPELGECSQAEIVNAYDNALLYTDHVLSETIARLREVDGYDTAMLYVSDHGESLGEQGLYLHGMPYAIAPQEQLRVPMVMWFSPRFAAGAGLDIACLQHRARLPASHDDLFSTVLGLFDVQTAARTAERDLLSGCRADASLTHRGAA